ncbi:hypothetical protein BV22DRAFT_1129637 [Leucogyrophana mollusca]|uniref:Uncharacterized protein n=1 Tax=Leucogyrophana mollusca TaxID=85980 RepID=A0ACB8BHC6_9AGAM|nr:hypothetical protein BV22DRAFT_1129637 [Leucogyrophana mollusca]
MGKQEDSLSSSARTIGIRKQQEDATNRSLANSALTPGKPKGSPSGPGKYGKLRIDTADAKSLPPRYTKEKEVPEARPAFTIENTFESPNTLETENIRKKDDSSRGEYPDDGDDDFFPPLHSTATEDQDGAIHGEYPDDGDDNFFPPLRSTATEGLLAVIRDIVDRVLANSPLRLIDTVHGSLCSPSDRRAMFEESFEFGSLLFLITNPPVLQHADSIRKVVERYFGYVMLSHRWQDDEPLYGSLEPNIYEMPASRGIAKLQGFCRTARNLGYRWAWSDTCCIDKTSSLELQETIVSMFSWYRGSALTIVYLYDFHLSDSEDLKRSDWFTRGWTLLEAIAPRIVRFYNSQWQPYIDSKQFNHKSVEPFLELLASATGVPKESLRDFTPGRHRAAEVLRWASNRMTTLPEDMAYSLMGLLDVQITVIYGEGERAYHRLLDALGLDTWSGIEQRQFKVLQSPVPQDAEGSGSSSSQTMQ